MALRKRIAQAAAAIRNDAEGDGAIMDVYGDIADAALAAIEASGTHVVVPVKPTFAMEGAGAETRSRHADHTPLDCFLCVGTIYRAMLAARPKP